MILESLKSRTDKLHREVEGENLAKYIIDHSITKSQYIHLLVANYLAYNTIESTVKRKSDLLPDTLLPFADMVKSDALNADLLQFDIHIDKHSFLNSIAVNKLPQLVGMMYVSEGSMMGGMLIARHLKTCTNLDDSLNHKFFNGQTKDILNRWKAFTTEVNTIQFSEEDIEEAVITANATFKLFGDVFKAEEVFAYNS